MELAEKLVSVAHNISMEEPEEIEILEDVEILAPLNVEEHVKDLDIEDVELKDYEDEDSSVYNKNATEIDDEVDELTVNEVVDEALVDDEVTVDDEYSKNDEIVIVSEIKDDVDEPGENEFTDIEGQAPVRGTSKLNRRQARIPWKNIALLPNLRTELADLGALSRSIKERGLIAPLVVRENPDVSPPYQLIAGYRRFEAFKNLNENNPNAEVLCIIIENTSDEEAFELMFLENIQRVQLEPMEIAKGFKGLLEKNPDWTASTLARSLGLKIGFVRKHLRMLELPEHVQDKLAAGNLSFSIADILTKAKEKGTITEKEYEEIVEEVATGEMKPGKAKEKVQPVEEPEEIVVVSKPEQEHPKETLEKPVDYDENNPQQTAHVAPPLTGDPNLDKITNRMEAYLLGRMVADYADDNHLRARGISAREECFEWAYSLTPEEQANQRVMLAQHILDIEDDPFGAPIFE